MKNTTKWALVTGGNRGIGKEICRQLAADGFQVILAARNEESGQKTAEELGERVQYRPLDVTDATSVEALARTIQEDPGRLDVLINNAGVLLNSDSILELSLEDLQQTLDVNYWGVLRMIRTMYPLLEQSESGRIVNVSSGMGSFDEMTGGHAAYRMSKTALNGLTAVFAAETNGTNVQTFSMSPGWVRTDMGGDAAPRSVEVGADTALWLATTDQAVSGKFYRDRKEIDW